MKIQDNCNNYYSWLLKNKVYAIKLLHNKYN